MVEVRKPILLLIATYYPIKKTRTKTQIKQETRRTVVANTMIRGSPLNGERMNHPSKSRNSQRRASLTGVEILAPRVLKKGDRVIEGGKSNTMSYRQHPPAMRPFNNTLKSSFTPTPFIDRRNPPLQSERKEYGTRSTLTFRRVHNAFQSFRERDSTHGRWTPLAVQNMNNVELRYRPEAEVVNTRGNKSDDDSAK